MRVFEGTVFVPEQVYIYNPNLPIEGLPWCCRGHVVRFIEHSESIYRCWSGYEWVRVLDIGDLNG